MPVFRTWNVRYSWRRTSDLNQLMFEAEEALIEARRREVAAFPAERRDNRFVDS